MIKSSRLSGCLVVVLEACIIGRRLELPVLLAELFLVRRFLLHGRFDELFVEHLERIPK